MTAQSGNLMLLSIHDGGAPGSYLPIGGLQHVTFQLSASPKRCDTLGGSAWRSLLEASGERSLSITAEGMFTANAGEARLFSQSLATAKALIRLTLQTGAVLQGDFIISRYRRDGNLNEEIKAALTFDSAGDITFA